MPGQKYEEFTVQQSDIDNAGLQKLVDKKIIKALESKLVGKQLLAIDKKLVGTAGKTRTFPKRTAVAAAAFSEGADISQINPDVTYSTADATPTMFGASDILYANAIDAADFDVINDTKEALTDAMARLCDSRIWDELLCATQITDEAVGTGDGSTVEFALDHPYVLEITEVTVNAVPTTAYTCDYHNTGGYAMLKFDVFPPNTEAIVATYKYISIAATKFTEANIIQVITAQAIVYKDLIAARTRITVAKKTPDAIVFDPEGAGQALVDDKFLDASAFGEKVVMNGQIGRIAGMAVLVSEEMYSNVPVLVKSGADLGYKVYKKMLSTKVDKLEKKAGDIFIGLWESSIPVVLNRGMISVLLNGQSDAYIKA